MDKDTPAINEAASGRERIGAKLAAARTAAKLDLVDIARETRVPLRHLRAIEADAHDSLPALPYSIGFVKTLARAVGVDAEAAAAQFRAETSKTAHVPAAVALEPLDERRLPPRELVVFSIVAVLALVGGIIAYASGLFDKAPPPPPVVVTATPAEAPAAPAPATGATPDAGAAPGPIVMPGPLPQEAAVPVGGSVTLTATEDVWVKIYDGLGTTAKSGVIKAGEVYIVPAAPPGLKLWTGKAGVISVAVGGKVLPPLGGPAQTIKDVSLAPADLVARAATPAAAPATAPVAAPR